MIPDLIIFPTTFAVRASVWAALGRESVHYAVDLFRRAGPGHYLLGGELLIEVDDSPAPWPRCRPRPNRRYRRTR